MLLGRSLDDHLVETVLITAFHRPAAIDALHEDFDIAVGKLQRLQNVRDRPDGIDVGRTRVVRGRVVLGCEEDPAIVRERVFERAHGGRSADDEGHHHIWKNYDVPQGDHWKRLVDFRAIFALLAEHIRRDSSLVSAWSVLASGRCPLDLVSIWGNRFAAQDATPRQ